MFEFNNLYDSACEVSKPIISGRDIMRISFCE